MDNTEPTIDTLLEDFDVWCRCESRECQRSVNYEQSKRAIRQYVSDQVAKAVEAKNNAYWERNQLVAYIASQYEAHMVRHPEDDKEWEDDWRWIICVHTPQGQLSWHIHDDEVPYFGWLEVEPDGEHWDGHTTEEKYDRITELRSKE